MYVCNCVCESTFLLIFTVYGYDMRKRKAFKCSDAGVCDIMNYCIYVCKLISAEICAANEVSNCIKIFIINLFVFVFCFLCPHVCEYCL